MSYHYSKVAFLGPESWSTCKYIRTVLKLVFKCEKWMWDWNRVPVQYEKVKHIVDSRDRKQVRLRRRVLRATVRVELRPRCIERSVTALPGTGA